MSSIGPRWKGKEFAAIAQDNPLSEIVKCLQASLIRYKPQALFFGSNVILEAQLELADLFDRACFGQPMATSEKDKRWFQLVPEEAFYLSHALMCLQVFTADGRQLNDLQLWMHLKANVPGFPHLYKAYSHLRAKNWVVRPGLQYGSMYVAYRHHPALVHSEYSVLVQSEDNKEADSHRLKDWTDWQCALRVSGGVAKTLLVLSVDMKNSNTNSPSCLEQSTVEEHIISRWVPELTRELSSDGNGALIKECSSTENLD